MSIFKMPSLGADMEAGTLIEWLVKPGDTVQRGDVVAVVETQKGAIEIEIFETGIVHRLEAEIGQEIPVGAALAVILAEGEAQPEQGPVSEFKEPVNQFPEMGEERIELVTSIPQAPSIQHDQHAVSPAARVRAQELGIDLSTLQGTGPQGAVVLSDVEEQSQILQGPQPRSSASSKSMEDMRKAIAAAMTRSKKTIPHFYLSQTFDIQNAVDWLEVHNKASDPSERLLLSVLFVRAVALAAANVQAINGHYIENRFCPSQVVNPGIAVALRGGGLVAPALNDAPALSLFETMKEMRDLVTRARAGRLKSSELTRGTITISALGESGVETMTGVIFPPQVALVGIGAPQIRPWVANDVVVPRTVVTLSVSADHRVADGRQVSRLLTEFDSFLQAPEKL